MVGPPRVGKMTLALDLARALNCVGDDRPCGECSHCTRTERGLHADVRVIGLGSNVRGAGRSRTLIGIDQVREVQREAALKPFEGTCRVFIIDGAERLSEEASNSLLKTLEEPPERVFLVLLASDAAALLATVVSRCQTLALRPVPAPLISRLLQESHDSDPASADDLARLSEGRPGWAVAAAADPSLREEMDGTLSEIEQLVEGGLAERFAYAERLATSLGRDREAVFQELGLWLAWWRDVLLIKEGTGRFATRSSRLEGLDAAAKALSSGQVTRAVHAVQEPWDRRERTVHARLALAGLMLSLPRPSKGRVE